jgi:hypothetical protein
MNCPSCQAEVKDTNSFCTKCGAALPKRAGPAVPIPAGTVSAPLPRPERGQPSPGASERALFLNFNEQPANIVQVMDQAKRQQGEFVTSFRQRLRVLLLLLPAGLPFVLLDWLLGNNFVTFSLVAYALWGAALVGWIVLRRESPSRREEKPRAPVGVVFGRVFGAIWVLFFAAIFLAATGLFSFLAGNLLLVVGLVLAVVALAGLIRLWRRQPSGEAFGARFDAVHTIFETLKDDLAPKRTLLGWLDLSGAQQPGKVVRETASGSGMPIKYYRDEWLRMKMLLYDGNLLRVSAVERVKARLGRWKRSMSGKSKWKPGGAPQARNELRIAVALNQKAYQVAPIQGGRVGKFLVEIPQSDDGRLELRASTDAPIDGWDILHLLRFAYDHIKPRGVPVVAEGQ